MQSYRAPQQEQMQSYCAPQQEERLTVQALQASRTLQAHPNLGVPAHLSYRDEAAQIKHQLSQRLCRAAHYAEQALAAACSTGEVPVALLEELARLEAQESCCQDHDTCVRVYTQVIERAAQNTPRTAEQQPAYDWRAAPPRYADRQSMPPKAGSGYQMQSYQDQAYMLEGAQDSELDVFPLPKSAEGGTCVWCGLEDRLSLVMRRIHNGEYSEEDGERQMTPRLNLMLKQSRVAHMQYGCSSHMLYLYLTQYL